LEKFSIKYKVGLFTNHFA